jgi:alpha-1,3-glucosyltransferase
VHEKSILLPLLPITMLAASEPDLALWAPVVGAFQMFPLLVRDGAATAYVASIALYLLVLTGLLPPHGGGAVSPAHSVGSGRWRGVAPASLAGAVALHALRVSVSAPARYPWLWDRAFVSYGFVFVAAGMAYTNYRQWNQRGTAAAGGRQAGGKGKRA